MINCVINENFVVFKDVFLVFSACPGIMRSPRRTRRGREAPGIRAVVCPIQMATNLQLWGCCGGGGGSFKGAPAATLDMATRRERRHLISKTKGGNIDFGEGDTGEKN